ncbi:MAG: hypothetical protein K8F92_20420 [Hyphomicrobium sp.]|uniref:phospholipase D-like domain-containing protein n=1 Tax=Hyphomicrobium sp. TaxID=82 RepID=UPI00132C740C|nr:phospholipase D-like domain-containing protein [Hyphomicrobium sp.]KAB2941351.1 MAG: hypothetical protein F9K20_09610 [Hyphomicrobium sp.]MBZ0211999.1 hypothetical protein [Hyphomicrobium sp.]
MTTVYVTFPVLRGSNRFFIQVGRRWSVIEHLLLHAAATKPASAAELAQKSRLPRRVVLEAFIRLMRAGWVEMITEHGVLLFRATPIGAVNAQAEQLPAATVMQQQWRSFHIEQVSGGVFRTRELETRPLTNLPTTNETQIVRHLSASFSPGQEHLSHVYVAIEGEDEEIVGIQQTGARLTERHAVVTVKDGVIQGLPARASKALQAAVLEAAEKALAERQTAPSSGKPAAHVSQQRKSTEAPAPLSRTALFDTSDLIVDGDAHRKSLEATIRAAKQRLIIHSTFVNDKAAAALLPSLLQAAARGAHIDLMFGQADVEEEENPSQAAAQRLAAAIANAGRKDAVTVHPFSTHSHAKIIVADNGQGAWQALIGSCNWLASDFSSFETSLRLREPAMVGEVIRALAGLSMGRPGVWTDFAQEMAALGRRIEKMPRGAGRTGNMRLLYAHDHAGLPLEARDKANARIFVLSHRLGIAARPVALLPILSAVAANNISAHAYYGRTTGPLSGAASAELIREYNNHGITIRPVHRPRLHAKVLGWDDDALAVTSLNWLSANPPKDKPISELGVLVESTKVAENFFRVFDNARYD